METERERVIRKVKALTSKTVENGATEAEMLLAISKANQLMQQYFIKSHDLQDTPEQCVLKEVELVKTHYKFSAFYYDLAKLFDCEHYYTRTKIAFFGLEHDVMTCEYLYYLIVRTALREKDLYLQTKAYKDLRSFYSPKTLANSFLKGFIFSVADRMQEMFEEKNKSIPDEYAIQLFDKRKQVQDEFGSLNLTIRTEKSTTASLLSEAVEDGREAGEKLAINKAIQSKQVNESRLIEN